MIWLEVSFSKNEERREDIRRLKLFLKSFDFPSLGAGLHSLDIQEEGVGERKRVFHI